jgi:hypothetical protein
MKEKRQMSRTTDDQYQRFAEQFVDMIFDSRKPWVFQHLVSGGFQNIPTWEDLNSGEFALQVIDVRRHRNTFWEPWVADALINEDRQKLVPYFKKDARDRRLTKDELVRLLEVGKSPVLKKSFKELASAFASRRGAKTKLPIFKYGDVLVKAELLAPAIEKLLEIIPKTSRTLVETLQYLQKDYPQATEFLLRHETLLQQALNDPKLLRRAKKRMSARARVLAAALAGAAYRLSFSTSVERIRLERRTSLKSSR